MYGLPNQWKRLTEQPSQSESEYYQNLEAVDRVAGLIGRLGALGKNPCEYPENELFRQYFLLEQFAQSDHRNVILPHSFSHYNTTNYRS